MVIIGCICHDTEKLSRGPSVIASIDSPEKGEYRENKFSPKIFHFFAFRLLAKAAKTKNFALISFMGNWGRGGEALSTKLHYSFGQSTANYCRLQVKPKA